MIRLDVREAVGKYLSEMMNAEMTHFLGRERYERQEKEPDYRNGSYSRHFAIKGIGEVSVRVPRDRDGKYETQVIPHSKQYEDEIRRDLCLMFLSGVSTRTLAIMSNRLIGRKISHTEISQANNELIDSVERWRNRDLSHEQIKYLFLDGVNFDMRVGDSIEKTPVLVAIGITETGQRLVLGLQAGAKESSSSWREFFKDLKRRGLDSKKIIMGVMDGLPGLEKVFADEFPAAKVQRCQVHVARNVLAKVPQKFKESVADGMRSIFYASSREKAREFFSEFKAKWKAQIPSAVKCLEKSLDACLTFFNCPEEEWISLRTPTSSNGSIRNSNEEPSPWRSWPGRDHVIRSSPSLLLR